MRTWHSMRPMPAATCLQPFRWISGGVALAGALMLSGCAGYRLGPVSGVAAGGKSVEVSPFINETLQPRLTDVVTLETRKELQRDGTYRLATHQDGEILLSGVLTRYQRTELTFAQRDILTVRDYRIELTAQVKAQDRATGKLLLNQSVAGFTLLRVGADLPSAERQAMPLLAADLAKRITALLADGKW